MVGGWLVVLGGGCGCGLLVVGCWLLVVGWWLWWSWWRWWWFRRGMNTRVFVQTVARFAHKLQTKQCQCTGPFGWTDQPEPPMPEPGRSGSRHDSNQPQGEEKGCEARPPLSQLLMSQGGRNLLHRFGFGSPGSGVTTPLPSSQ